MTRDDIIAAIADAIGQAEGSPGYDRGFDIRAAKAALSAIEAQRIRLVPVDMPSEVAPVLYDVGAASPFIAKLVYARILKASTLNPAE